MSGSLGSLFSGDPGLTRSIWQMCDCIGKWSNPMKHPIDAPFEDTIGKSSVEWPINCAVIVCTYIEGYELRLL